MAAFKLTTWNVEWLGPSFDVASGAVAPESRQNGRKMPSVEDAKAKLDGIERVIKEIDPDILLLVEAVGDPDRMADYVKEHLSDFVLIDRPDEPKSAYHIRGDQWMWFLTKPAIRDERDAKLLDIATWHAYTREIYTNQGSRQQHKDGWWWISTPKLDKKNKVVGAHVHRRHSHHRHPQVLVLDWNGTRVEFIGVHFKSKFVRRSVPRRYADESDKDYFGRDDVKFYMANAVAARSKLTTEATDVRNYIDHRFRQESLPAIFVLGDVNDGPGKELLEREYLLHDLVGSLQGDVFFARQFLNHALFDNEDELRWSVKFRDKLDPRRSPHILLDHIMFTEALSRRGLGPLIVNPQKGKVEHEIHERISSLMPSTDIISDHRPVSLVVSERRAEA